MRMGKFLFLKRFTSNLFLMRSLSSYDYFVSTPIFYVNGVPHIGHMQSCLYADAFARIQRLLGKNVLFSTGTDEHGLKVQKVAEAMKKEPIDFCSEMSKKFEEIIRCGDISFTNFIQTSDENHKHTVQNFWRKLKEGGYIKKAQYEGWYSIADEAFVPSSQIKEVKEGPNIRLVSNETGAPVEKMSEENYVFSLSSFQEDILYWLTKDVIKPSIFKDVVKKWVEEGLGDLSVSRPKSRLYWGIPVPDDDTQIIYVWLDALINYLTVGQSSTLKGVWPVDCHVIGKDILKFHSIYWPAFLIAAGYEPPRNIFCHAHWTVNYEKMSKSKGNVIDPMMLINKYSLDGFRYFLLRASVPQSDTNYSEVKIHRMVNAELADTLGNLLSRSCAVALNPSQEFPKYYEEMIDTFIESNVKNLIKNTSDLPEIVQQHFLEGNFYKGIDSIMACLREANAFMQFNKPWELAKLKDQKSIEKLSTLLHIVLEVLRITGILLQPIIPTLSDKLLTKLRVPSEQRGWQNINCFPSIYHLPNSLEGQQLGKDSNPLFERRKQM